MTEEIIIDGVNVSECDYISDLDCSCIFVKNYYGTTTSIRCSQVKNCHYKQLKRLEQENKELKRKIEILLGQLVINDGEDVTVQISQSQFDEYNELKQENEKLLDARNHFMGVNLKYFNALEEIKSIADKFDYWNNNLPEASEVISEIKDKINEVLK
jgi:chromosome segregation ATPase